MRSRHPSFLTSFILAMLLYPEIQKCVQAEIDAVVGQDQFPAFEDREKLLYVDLRGAFSS
ncbi:uncharacterized protein HD556DRAFT_117987 [Suillus plorans]|uniref:Uncharacterized protein n=1 Tax=Suillus plorans TaxID=116603 RepID=A0A9P7J2G8_9AGAM|nr:uncharacterized protein HD556DRAFT_117987 [Suillus plorans]KAG1799277.1 hypothetical protein HD556DRAFT_117987 [Suillus plorans]